MTETRPICFLDVETLGLDPDAPIWEFAAVTVFPDGNEDSTRFCIRHDPAGWLDSLDAAFADDYRTRYQAGDALDELSAAVMIRMVTKDAIIVACNPVFDEPRLAALLRRNNIEPAWHYHPLDIASMAIGFLAGRGQLPPQPWKSDMLANAIGVNTAQFLRHTAKGDVDWARAQWEAMATAARPAAVDAAHIDRQREFSVRTFGPGPRTAGVLDHITKELEEIRKSPDDLSEWADVIILALDGAWRTGAEPQDILDAIAAKQAKNEARVWPDWRTQDPNKAIEHDRTAAVQA